MGRIPTIALLFGLLWMGCKKDDPVVTTTGGSSSGINCANFVYPAFTGYTKTDPQGVVISEDTTDWQLRSAPEGIDACLFTDSDNYVSCPNTFGLSITPVFPNPSSQGVYSVGWNLGAQGLIDIRLVDDQGNTLVTADNVTATPISFNDSQADSNAEMMRLYYRIVYKDSCAFYGHGDISLTF